MHRLHLYSRTWLAGLGVSRQLNVVCADCMRHILDCVLHLCAITSGRVCIHTHICACVLACMSTHNSTRTSIHKSVGISCIFTRLCPYLHTCPYPVCTRVHTYWYASVYTHVYTQGLSMRRLACAQMHIIARAPCSHDSHTCNTVQLN